MSAAAGHQVLDRRMFKSIHFRGRSGVLFELATDQPGFGFEPPDIGGIARADR
jgi:hypothetical protein